MERFLQQGQMLANRVAKTYGHLRRPMAREQIEAFRLYDRDIPEIRAVVDWYAGHLLLAEYVRTQSEPDWLPAMAAAVAARLEVPPEHVHLRQRRTGRERYSRLDHRGERIAVRERDLRFWVNLNDFQDTGLFADHRETRRRVAAEARDQRVLNLFGYTGAFTCWAAWGGARTTTTVDLSATYLDWASDNLALNNLGGPQHNLVRADAVRFLFEHGGPWDLIVLDPPSRSVSSRMQGEFDVQRDHRPLVEACLQRLAPGGVLWFSTNHQRFAPALDGLPAEEWTARTVPIDFRNRQAHRVWRLQRE
jgi:23S rRNA G2069 N7-methylase RlmK/C1962 C5-methylase RlmI